MNTELEQSTNQFIEYKNALGKKLAFEYDFNLCISSLLCIRFQKTMEPLKVIECKRMIKKNTNIMSNYRGIIGLHCTTLLSFYEKPEELLKKAITTNKYLRKNGFKNSNYLSYSLLQKGKNLMDLEDESLKEKVLNYYQEIKKLKLPMNAIDYGFLSIITTKDENNTQFVNKIESLYRLAKNKGIDKLNCSLLAKILCLTDSDEETLINDTYTLYDKLKAHKIKLSDYFSGTHLGILTLLSNDFDETIKNLLEVNQFLRQNKGFSNLMSDKGQRMLYSVLLVCMDLSNKRKDMNSHEKQQLLDIAFATAVSTGAGILSNFE